jgi:imidazoleglycerol-phosphate dehydratase
MTIERETRETTIRVAIQRNTEAISVDTPIAFLTHMMETLSRYAGLGVALSARGDLRHHIIEDVAITFGTALRECTPTSAARYGHRVIPMDDALVEVAIDLGGRPFYGGKLPSRMYDHWMRSFADNAGCTLHINVKRGSDRHHIVEAAFKALGLAIRDAMRDSGDVFSTKGSVTWRKPPSPDGGV